MRIILALDITFMPNLTSLCLLSPEISFVKETVRHKDTQTPIIIMSPVNEPQWGSPH